MKIEYKILWLDDNINIFVEDELISEIESHLTDNGFIPIIETASNAHDFFEKLKQDSDHDLILTDFHMSDMNGDLVVEKIRSSEYSIMTEILFYTAQADLKDTDRISRVSFLETRQKTSRGSHAEIVVEETKKLIDLTVKKFQNIVAMRGMIMHETSDLDERMFSFIDNYIKTNEVDDEFRKLIVDPIGKFHKEKFDKFTAHTEKNNIDKIISDPVMFSASHRASAIQMILKRHELTCFINEYKDEVISLRNKFAHAKLMTLENGERYFENKNENIKFDSDLCKKIRSDLIKHDKHIRFIENHFKA
jgi:CheY-like chemotaxis protein